MAGTVGTLLLFYVMALVGACVVETKDTTRYQCWADEVTRLHAVYQPIGPYNTNAQQQYQQSAANMGSPTAQRYGAIHAEGWL